MFLNDGKIKGGILYYSYIAFSFESVFKHIGKGWEHTESFFFLMKDMECLAYICVCMLYLFIISICNI